MGTQPVSRSVEATNGSTRSGVLPFVGLLLAVLVASTAATIIRMAQQHAGSLSVATWRLILGSAMLAPLALATRRAELRGLSRREWRSAILSGILLGAHFAAWVPSVALTTVAASVLLVNTHPIVVAIASRRIVGERLPSGMVIALLTASAGAVLVALGHTGDGSHRLLGDLLALAGGVTVAGYFLIGRQLRGRLSLLAYVWPVYTAAAATLILILLLSGQEVLPRDGEGWLWILLLALGPQIVGHTLLNWALRYLSAIFVTLTALLMPIASTLFAWWLLGERPAGWAIAGGALVLAGVAIATRSERNQAQKRNASAPGSTPERRNVHPEGHGAGPAAQHGQH